MNNTKNGMMNSVATGKSTADETAVDEWAVNDDRAAEYFADTGLVDNPEKPSSQGPGSRLTGYRFSLGELHFLDNSNSLREVLDVPEITSVAGTADWFSGLATVQSEMLPVTDFRAWLGLPDQVRSQHSSKMENDRDIASVNRGSARRLLVVEQSTVQSTNFGNANGAGQAVEALEKPGGGEQIGVIVDQVIGYTEALATAKRSSDRPANSETSTQTLSPSDWLGRLLSGATPIRNLTPVCEQRIASLVSRVLDDVLIVGGQTLLICDLSRLLTIPSLRDIRNDASKKTLSAAEVTA